MGGGSTSSAQRQLSLLFAALAAVGGVQVAFFPVWLGARGLDGGEIALILSACPAIRIVSSLIGPRLGDKTGAYGRLILIHAALAVAIFVLLGFVEGFPGLLFFVTALAFAQAPIGPLADGLALGESRRRRALGLAPVHFPAMRGYASASSLLFMLASGPVARATPSGGLIWIMTAISLLSTASAFFLLRGFAAARTAETLCRDAPAEPLRRPLLIALIIACAALVHGSHGFLTAFASLRWAARGFDETFIAVAWAVATAADTLFFLVAGRWFGGEARAVSLLMIGAAGAVLRWAIFANDPDAAGVLLAQCLSPLSSAAMGLGSAWLIAELGGAAYTARVHGWLSAAYGVALSFGLYVSGPLKAAFGELGYLAMAAMAGAGLLLTFAVDSATRRGLIGAGKKEGQAARAACPHGQES